MLLHIVSFINRFVGDKKTTHYEQYGTVLLAWKMDGLLLLKQSLSNDASMRLVLSF